MKESEFISYIEAFNTRDYDRMISYYRPDVVLELPAATPEGPQGIKAYYQNLHADVRELLSLDYFVADGDKLAVELYTEFRARNDRPGFSFRPLKAGDVFRCTNMVHYDLSDGLFASIRIGRYKIWEGDDIPARTFPGVSL